MTEIREEAKHRTLRRFRHERESRRFGDPAPVGIKCDTAADTAKQTTIALGKCIHAHQRQAVGGVEQGGSAGIAGADERFNIIAEATADCAERIQRIEIVTEQQASTACASYVNA